MDQRSTGTVPGVCLKESLKLSVPLDRVVTILAILCLPWHPKKLLGAYTLSDI